MGKYPVSWRVYRLFHESTPDTVYIGITSKTLEARRKQHFQSPLHAERNWIETLRATGQQPRICLVGCLDAAERFEAEQQEYLVILQEYQAGRRVLNVCHMPRDGMEKEMLQDERIALDINLSEVCQAGSVPMLFARKERKER